MTTTRRPLPPASAPNTAPRQFSLDLLVGLSLTSALIDPLVFVYLLVVLIVYHLSTWSGPRPIWLLPTWLQFHLVASIALNVLLPSLGLIAGSIALNQTSSHARRGPALRQHSGGSWLEPRV